MRRNLIALAAAPLALAATLGGTEPASAGTHVNGTRLNSLTANAFTQNALTAHALTANSLTTNSLSQNALSAAGSPLGQLDGVAVEAVVLPSAAR